MIWLSFITKINDIVDYIMALHLKNDDRLLLHLNSNNTIVCFLY